jgi:hypothetical protein
VSSVSSPPNDPHQHHHTPRPCDQLAPLAVAIVLALRGRLLRFLFPPCFHIHDLHFPWSSTPPIPRPCNYSPFWLSHCLHSTSCLLFSVLHCLLKQCPRGLLLLRLQSCTVRHRAKIPSQRLYRTVLQLALSVSCSPPRVISSSSTQNQDLFLLFVASCIVALVFCQFLHNYSPHTFSPN